MIVRRSYTTRAQGAKTQREGMFVRNAIGLRRSFDIGPPPKLCRYPLWGDEKPTHQYCGEPVWAAGKSYCGAHHRLCWRPAESADVGPMPYLPGRMTSFPEISQPAGFKSIKRSAE